MGELSTITPSRLALELQDPLAEPAWYLLQTDDVRGALTEIVDTLEGAEVTFECRSPADPETLLTADPGPVRALVVAQLSAWPDAAYHELDRWRHALRERWPILIWLTDPAGVARMVHLAPNFAAFFNATTAPWSSGIMSSRTVDEHLADLRSRWGLTDEAFLDAVRRGEHGTDPEHHLWLILLGRGDLIQGASAGVET